MNNFRTSAKGRNLVKYYEGLELTAYLCPADVLTIGYGHTGPDVKVGQKIDIATAEALLIQDLRKFEDAVLKLVKVPLTQNQFDALVSFAYNLGAGNLGKSTLLKKLNAKDYAGAAEEFLKWNKAAGKVLEGLTKRRKAERLLFLGKV